MTTTLEMAACWVAAATGKQWPADKAVVLNRVNDVRELIYDLSVLPWMTTLCVPVRWFCMECDTCGGFPGISLPSFAANTLGVYSDGRAIPVVDRWGVYPYDENTLASCPSHRFVDLGEDYPFISDPPCGTCYKISLLARAKADVGKIVTLRFVDANNIERVEELALAMTRVETQHNVMAIARSGVSLPVNMVGSISVRTGGSVALSEWQPWEIVPGYRRLRLESTQCSPGCMVVVHAERRRTRLMSLADPVETDQKLIWEDGAKYLMLHNKVSADSNDTANANKFLASFRLKLEEASRRTRGRTHKRALNFISKMPRRSGLIRNR